MNRYLGRSFLPSSLFLFFTFFSFSTARDTISPSQPLADNETLISSNGQFALGFFNPTKSTSRYIGLWYHKIEDDTILWVANRKNPIINSSGILSITSKGNLTITSKNSSVVWSTNTTGLANPIAQLLDNGNLVIFQAGDNNRNYSWQGFHYLTDTWLPGMKVGVDKTTGIYRNLVSWNSYNDPSQGSYLVYMDIKGDPEFYFSQNSTVLWRSGPWDGTHMTGIPQVLTYKGFTFSFVNNEQEASYSYTISNESLVSRLFVNYTGLLQRAIWVWDTNQWNYFWSVPKDPCDYYRECGQYGSCDPNNLPVCNCLSGFRPKNPANWNLRDAHDGCVRKTGLDCKNGTDGFKIVNNVKPPETENCTVDMSLSLDECRGLCLKNCSCTAYATANVSGGGSGCVIWVGELFDIKVFVSSGQDLYIRLAAADLGTPAGQSSRNSTIAIVTSLVAGAVLVACVGFLVWRRNKRKLDLLGSTTSFNDQSNNEGTKGEDLDLPIFEFGTIAAATDYFSSVNKLGEGGFGPVYKGKLGEDQEIAVKRLSKTSTQGLEEFKNEVVLIAKLQHRNLVRLVGCCIQERMLIYEYMPNGSLDVFLFGNDSLLGWKTRYQIIVGVARGLLYLHEDSRFKIIHRDLKASNILLDKEMNPKISDFGMARIFGEDETYFNTRKIVGTYGYMAPEYAMDGVFSVKSDVFSFGVLILEIISGKKNRGVYAISPHKNLVAHAWSLWSEGKSMQLVGELMSYSFSMDEVLRCIKVGLLCVQELPEDRPLMSYVILMLGSDVASLPQPKQPSFAVRKDPSETQSSSSKQDSCTLNNITITVLEGR